MAIKIGINGFGRIGRLVFRRAMELGHYEFVAVNDLTDAKTLAHLLKYDSAHGKFNGSVHVDGTDLIVNGARIKITAERDPSNLKWGELGVDIAIESTGLFASRAGCEKHLSAGAKKVILTVPAKDAIDSMVVLGVNDSILKPEHKIVSRSPPLDRDASRSQAREGSGRRNSASSSWKQNGPSAVRHYRDRET